MKSPWGIYGAVVSSLKEQWTQGFYFADTSLVMAKGYPNSLFATQAYSRLGLVLAESSLQDLSEVSVPFNPSLMEFLGNLQLGVQDLLCNTPPCNYNVSRNVPEKFYLVACWQSKSGY